MSKRWLVTSIAVGLATALFAWIFSLTPIAHRFDNNYGLAILYSLRGPVRPPEHAIIIAIDRNTITWLRQIDGKPSTDSERLLSCLPASTHGELSKIRGPGSLPRSVYGCLVSQLSEVGYPAVVFDILFSVKGVAEDDMMFARAIKEHGAIALLVGLERSTVRDGASELLVEHEVQPITLFAENAAARGAFIVSRTGGPVYGYWRKLPGFEDTQSLPDVAYNLHRLLTTDESIDKTEKPVFEHFWLYGPPGSIKTISARDILSGEIPDAIRTAAQISVAFVGASDTNMTNFPDTFPSLLHGRSGADISGVELATTAFLNLNANERLLPLSPVADSMVTMLFAFALGFLVRARSGYAMLVAPSAAILYLGAAAFAFSYARIFMPIATPVFVVAPTAFVLAIVVRYRFARALLMHLAPAPIARRMLTKASDHRAEAVPDEATVVFFDLIGSTGIAEKIPPVDFSVLLNNYHNAVTEFVEKHRGLIISFSGDGVLAVYTQSDAGADHAVRACRSVISVVRGIRRINATNKDSGLPPLHLRIGVNSGSVAEGDIGAHDRFNFSVVGDVVNLASRLEQLGKTLYPDEKDVILVGGATHRLAKGQGFHFADCGFQQIRGRENPESTYRLLIS